MHIPDGIASPEVALLGFIEFAAVLAFALRLAKKRIAERDIPRIAMLAAGLFVAQMVNFPVGGGTSGHLIGGALCAILVGPWAAILAMSVVVIIQALVFGDGGITALGLNGMNMAVIAPLTGWGIYTLIAQVRVGNEKARIVTAMAASSWASVVVAASACAAELAVSEAISGGSYGIAAPIVVPSMLGWHVLIGIGEAIITCAVIGYVHQVHPRLFKRDTDEAPGRVRIRGVGVPKPLVAASSVLIVFALVLPLYFIYASGSPDGLERTMTDAGVDEPDSVLTNTFGYGDTYLTALIAGVGGFIIIALLLTGVSEVASRFRDGKR